MLEDLAKGMMEQAMTTMPACEICHGTLMGGSFTYNGDKGPMILCMKCVFRAITYYVRQREERLKIGEGKDGSRKTD